MTAAHHKTMILLLIVLSMFANISFAQERAYFNRLFTDKKTRADLNRAREQYKLDNTVPQTSVSPTEDITLPGLKLNGVIIRENGQADVWINNSASFRNNNISEQVRNSSRRVRGDLFEVTLPDGDKVKLRPGQIYSLETGQIVEAHEETLPQKPVAELPPATTATETAPLEINPEENKDSPKEEFDEAQLAVQDFRIKLLEERIEKLEKLKPDE